MSLTDNIKVNTYYTRSINLERDADSLEVVKAYIPTTRSLQTLAKISHSLVEDTSPRAWSLVGPYGSGKSSFANFLSHLLTSSDDQTSAAAEKLLLAQNKSLGQTFKKIKKDNFGHCSVLLTGNPEPLSKALIKTIASSAEQYFNDLGKKNLKIINELKAIAEQNEVSTNDVLKAIKKLQNAIAKAFGNGVLIIIDELGKFLEYEARHYSANEIYLLQALAEHAYTFHEAKLSIIVLLHQSFDQYAKGLGESFKNEWAKIQGRYENISFLESQEQVLRVVGIAFEQKITSKDQHEINKKITSIVGTIEKEKAFPGSMNNESAIQVFNQCYPLHPMSALILPVLCQKIAQNERTLFSYLGSQEAYGFKDSLNQCEKIGDWVFPWEIYEYFILNQPTSIHDHIIGKRWAEVVTAVERLGDAPEDEIKVLKTIGLLNIIGAQGGLKASKAMIELCLPTKQRAKAALKNLTEKSIIQFRKFSNEYRVWQGSDFDIDQSVEAERQKLGTFSLAQVLNANNPLLPIVARKYTIQHGTLRYFQPYFIDPQTIQQLPKNQTQTRLLIYLKDQAINEDLFNTGETVSYSPLDIVVEYVNTPMIREAVGEVMALEQVQKSAQELHSDPVAKREFSERYNAAVKRKEELLTKIIDSPEKQQWFWKYEKLSITNKRALQGVLSNVLEEIYNACPDLKNELVNRDTPSAQANAARNKLLQAMLNNETKPDLDIDKFPPEKAIYRSVLRETGLHKKLENGEWGFVEPSKKSSFYQAWKRIDTFLESTEKQEKSFTELNKELMAAPFGIKAGVLPIVYIAAYLAYQHELAIYENRRYKPFITEEMLERFVKQPNEFTFQRFRIEGLKASLFKQYSKVIFNDDQQRPLLDLAQSLAIFMGGLPEFTKKTRREISNKAVAVRSAFNLAKSPEILLIEALPKALGFDKLNEDATKQDFEKFAASLTEALRELKNAYNTLLEKQKQYLAQAFRFEATLERAELRRLIYGYCHGLENYTVDTQGLRAFIIRLTKKPGPDGEWFENILMFLGQKPSSKWDDSDQDKAEYRLSDFSRRVVDLEKIRLHEKDRSLKGDVDFDVYLLRSVKKGGDFLDEVVAVDQQCRQHIATIKQAVQKSLNHLDDEELKLAALAEIVDEFLNNYRSSQQKKEQKPQSIGKTKRPRKTK